MLLVLSRILSRSTCILILVVSNLACSAPLKSRRRAENEREQGFSASPRILEIQLPLKIASREDLVAWSKYVMTLVASKTNFTSSMLKNDVSSIGPQFDKRVGLANSSGFKSKETTKKAAATEKRQGINYPARRLKEPPVRSANDKVVAYPLPVGKMKFTAAKLQEPFGLPTVEDGPASDQQLYLEQYANFNFGDPFREPAIFGAHETLAQPPAATYLPPSLRPPIDLAPYQNIVDRNASGLEEPAKLSTKKSSLNLRVKALNNELAQMLLRNRSRAGEPLLTFPFQAVITITRQLPAATTTSEKQRKDYFAARDPPDEFPPYFEKNYTLTNESGRVNVIFDDFATSKKKTKKNEDEEENEEEEEEKEEEEEEDEGEREENGQDVREQRKKSEKKKKVKQQKSKKRQSFVLGDLLRMLGILRKLPKNTTDVNVAAPVLSILKGTNQPKIQVSFEDMLPNRERRNETFAQQTNDDDDDDDEEEEGGSIQALLDLLPLAAPILEELSDPESDVNLAEVLQSAIPLLEGLSDPNEEGGIDLPGVLVPLSQRLSEGPEGEGSDSGAILGPLIQLIAPLIGPLVGPLIGPLSRTSSGPGGKEGSGALITSLSGPLSEPTGAYGQSVFSGLVASITARLSKELAKSAGDSDVKSLVSAVVSGVLAGTSAGSSTASKGGHQHKDTYYAPTTYGQYSKPESPDFGQMITAAIKEILGAILKLSATSSTSSANLSGTSSSSSASLSASSSESKEQQPMNPTYGPPSRPSYYAPPAHPTSSTYNPPSSSYTTFTRRQTRQQIKKF